MRLPLISTIRAFERLIVGKSYIRIQPAHTTPKDVGISFLRQLDKDPVDEDRKSRFPTLEKLGIETISRTHNFSVPCDQVIKFIKLGAINKHIAIQYCHYLADQARNAQGDDIDYYSKACADLMSYILRNNKDLVNFVKSEILADVSSTSINNCRLVFRLLDDDMMDKVGKLSCLEIMSSIYKFELWDLAQSMVMRKKTSVTIHTLQPLIAAIIDAAAKYVTLVDDPEAQEKLRSKVLEHLLSVLEKCRTYRIPFVTKEPQEFKKALRDLKFLVQMNTTIKSTGRCTSCNSCLPTFDSTALKTINEAISKQLYLTTPDKEIYLNAAPNDSRRFEKLLEEIFAKDKKPIDCVIDGLNVAYKNSLGFKYVTKTLNLDDHQKTFKYHDVENQARVLINIIIRGNFLKTFKKILVVGKFHMYKWPGLMDFFKDHGIFFFPSYNNSKDDLFMLYAATFSPRTILVTNDFLRDHLARLDFDARTLLERWIDTRQLWIAHKNLKPIWPTPYEKIPSVHRETGFFHIPLIDGNMLEAVGVTDPPHHLNSKMVSWLCCSTNPCEEVLDTTSDVPSESADLVNDINRLFKKT